MSQMMAAQARKPVQSAPASTGGVLQRRSDKRRKKKPLLQREAAGPAPETVPPIVHEVLRSPGQPLDAATRAFMEPRFGHDFSRVRVHTDAKAAESARAVNALAYTVGNSLVFGARLYAMETSAGRRLLAHELAHVVQQRAGGNRGDSPDSPVMEQEAERVAWGARLGGGRVTVSGAALVGLACLPRSFRSSLDPSTMFPIEIEQEIFEIRQWLEANPQSSADRQWLLRALRSLERHLPGVTVGLPIARERSITISIERPMDRPQETGYVNIGMGFVTRFNDEFRSVLHALEPDAPGGRVSQERLWHLFTPAQREKLADFMVTRRIPERLFNGADNMGRANAQQRILISAYIITHGTYRPGSFEQRIHARYCGHWVQIVHQYAGVTPASGSWPEGLAGRGVMGSFDPMGVPVLGAGQAETIFGGVRASAEDLPIPEGTGHARTREREEEQLADDPTARRRVHRRTQFGMERFDELHAGDWLYLYNANESATGQHSVIFSRWGRAGELEGTSYRRAIIFNQPRPESGGREQTILLGDRFTPSQRANAEQGIPYRPQIDAITLVVRVPSTARPASTPAELLPSVSSTRAEIAGENNRYIREQERRLGRTVDRNRLKQWLRNENMRFIASLWGLMTANERALLTEANRSTQIEDLVRLYQRLRALSINAARAEQSRRSTFGERLSTRHAEAQARLDELQERAGPEVAAIEARLSTLRARVIELESGSTDRQIREQQAELNRLSRQIQRLSRGEERTRLQGEREELRASIGDLRRQQQAQRTELRRLRQQVAALQQRLMTIQRQVSAAEGRLPFGLLPGRARDEDPGIITGRLHDLRPQPQWPRLVVQSAPAARQGED